LLYNRDFAASTEAVQSMFSDMYYLEVQKKAFEHVTNPNIYDASARIYERGLWYVEKNRKPGHLLDVGCAFGTFLEFAKDRGWDVKGIEVSPYSSRFAREKRGLDVTTGTLATSNFGKEEFDLVTFWDVLEHVTDVKENLQRASRVLKPGGYVILTTDNYQSLLAFIASAMFILSAKAFAYPIQKFFIRYNSCYFKPGDLRRQLRQVGLDEAHIEGIDYPVEKIRLSRPERLALRCLYLIGDLLRMNTQFLMVAKKKA
jgi:2-polyprenyl-3-methyl-5-hydroxy-6-metoxy-1,4-benzoquinol methylase